MCTTLCKMFNWALTQLIARDDFIAYHVVSMSAGWDYASGLRPLTGLLLIPQTIYEYGEPRRNDIDRENLRTRRKTCPIATLSTTNPTRTDLGTNQTSAVTGRRLTAWPIARPWAYYDTEQLPFFFSNRPFGYSAYNLSAQFSVICGTNISILINSIKNNRERFRPVYKQKITKTNIHWSNALSFCFRVKQF
jgi:hypothetical protein